MLASAGAALIAGAFFLDWFAGSAEFGARDFSGADLARLIRNFDIVASSSSESGQLRAWAIVLYVAPALAINGAVMSWLPVRVGVATVAALCAGVYTAGLLTLLFVLTVAPWTDLERVLGGTLTGFWATALGAALLLCAGIAWSRVSSVSVVTTASSPNREEW